MDEPKSCREVLKKDNDKAIYEVSIDCFYLDYTSPYEFGFGLCPIFCCLYKKYGTPENPEPQYVHQCQYYREDKELMDKVSRQMPPIVIANRE